MITQQYLKDILTYRSESGEFVWKQPPANLRRLIGTTAGSKRADGYIRIHINGKRHYAHRLAWIYVTGEQPALIDHINQNKSDNRIENLRSVTQVENMRNRKRSSSNTSGHAGVVFSKRDKKWIAQIMINDKGFYLGAYTMKEDAINARRLASQMNGFTELHV